MIINGLNLFIQKQPTTCIPTCMASVMQWLGKSYSPAELIKSLKTHTWQGTDFCFTINFAEKEGFTAIPFCQPVRMTKHLLEQGWPVLIFMKQPHGIHCRLLYGTHGDGWYMLHDPATGELPLHEKEIDRLGVDTQFGGFCYYLLIIKPEAGDGDLLDNLTASDPFFHNVTGELLYYFRNEYTEAVQSWEKALALKNDYAEVYNNLAVYHLEQTHAFTEAMAWANKACLYDRDELTYYLTLGEIYLKSDDRVSFLNLVKDLDKRWPKNFAILRLREKGKKSWA